MTTRHLPIGSASMSSHTEPDFNLFQPGKSPLLPASFWPNHDELLSSWIVRLAHAHRMKAHTFTRFNFPNFEFWNRDIDRSIRDELIIELAGRTNATTPRIYNSTLRSYEGILFEKDSGKTKGKWIMPLGIFHRTWRRHGLMYCPGCLENDKKEPYYRKHWRISFNLVCLNCECRLLDACPQCDAPVTFFRTELGVKFNDNIDIISKCYLCKFPLSDGPRFIPDKRLAEIQKKLIMITAEGWKTDVIYPLQFFEVLNFLLKVFTSNRTINLKAQMYIAGKLRIQIYTAHRSVSPEYGALPIFDRANGLKMAFWVLDDWPRRFIKTFRKLCFHSSDLTRDFKNMPFWYFSVVFENFHVSNVNRRF